MPKIIIISKYYIYNQKAYYCHQSNHSLVPEVWSWFWMWAIHQISDVSQHWLMDQSLLCIMMSQPEQILCPGFSLDF